MNADLATWSARLRGLSTRRLRRPELLALCDARDLDELAGRLGRLGRAPGGGEIGSDPVDLCAAIDRCAEGERAIAVRWSGEGEAILPLLFLEEELRSLRALARGALHGVPPRERRAAATATPGLDGRTLDDLAGVGGLADLARRLRDLGHPAASVLERHADAASTDPTRLELELDATLLGAGRRASRALGPRARGELRRYLGQRVDLRNAWTALAGRPLGADPLGGFLEGGEQLGREAFLRVRVLPAGPAAARALAAVFRRTPLEPVFRGAGGGVRIPGDSQPVWDHPEPAWEERAWAAQLEDQRRRAARDPLGVASVLRWLLRLRVELCDLRRVVWGVALGVPGSRLAAGLLTEARG